MRKPLLRSIAAALLLAGTLSWLACGWMGDEEEEEGTEPVAELAPLEVGGRFACALRAGRVFCWGTEIPGVPDAQRTSPTTAIEIPGVSDVAEISAGEERACARTNAGALWCWGQRLGVRSIEQVDRMPPTQIATGVRFIDQSAEALVTTSESGAVTVYGYDLAARGDARTWLPQPRVIPGLTGVRAYGTRFAVCAVDGSGNMSCEGDPAVDDSTAWLAGSCDDAPGGARMYFADTFACSVQAQTASCFGKTYVLSQLLLSGARHDCMPITVSGGGYSAALPIDGSPEASLLLVQDDGTLSCRGGCRIGEQAMPTVAGVENVSGHGNYACAARAGGAVTCWGRLFGPDSPDVGWSGSTEITFP